MVHVPSLKPGNYRLQMVLDTKSPLGKLVSERTVKLAYPKPAKAAVNTQGKVVDGDGNLIDTVEIQVDATVTKGSYVVKPVVTTTGK